MRTAVDIESELAAVWRAYIAALTRDAFGNITQIANPAVASSSATTAFTYDVLNRLLSASTTAATSTPYRQQYEYDTLGSVMRWGGSTASSTFTYAGTGYANPHAVTQTSNGVSTTTYSYDTNGNLAQKVTDGVTTTYLWDYANRLTTLGVNNSTTTYGYDAFGARMYQIASTTATTTYASKWYSIVAFDDRSSFHKQHRDGDGHTVYSSGSPRLYQHRIEREQHGCPPDARLFPLWCDEN